MKISGGVVGGGRGVCVQEGEGRGSVCRSRSQDYIYPETLETEPRVQGFIISLPRNIQRKYTILQILQLNTKQPALTCGQTWGLMLLSKYSGTVLFQ